MKSVTSEKIEGTVLGGFTFDDAPDQDLILLSTNVGLMLMRSSDGIVNVAILKSDATINVPDNAVDLIPTSKEKLS